MYVKDPATGKYWAIDPNEAAGKNLDDPDVRNALIQDAKEKGNERTEGDPMGDTDAKAGDPKNKSGDGSDGQAIGCDPSIYSNSKKKVQAMKQQETEAAKALITTPASIQQLTCFDQYAKLNAEKIGKIHSDPIKGISKSIAPNVEMPNMQFIIDNFMSSVLGGGLQSMLNGAMSKVTGALSCLLYTSPSPRD